MSSSKFTVLGRGKEIAIGAPMPKCDWNNYIDQSKKGNEGKKENQNWMKTWTFRLNTSQLFLCKYLPMCLCWHTAVFGHSSIIQQLWESKAFLGSSCEWDCFAYGSSGFWISLCGRKRNQNMNSFRFYVNLHNSRI